MSGRLSPPGMPPTRQRVTRMTFLDRTVECVECGESLPPGTPLAAWPIGPRKASYAHDGGCPPRWSPTVIAGGGETTPRPLPWLHASPAPGGGS